jgi:hypothetical protein
MTSYIFNPSICDMDYQIHPRIYFINQLIQDDITNRMKLVMVPGTRVSSGKRQLIKIISSGFGISSYKVNQLYQYQLDNMSTSDNTKNPSISLSLVKLIRRKIPK